MLKSLKISSAEIGKVGKKSESKAQNRTPFSELFPPHLRSPSLPSTESIIFTLSGFMAAAPALALALALALAGATSAPTSTVRELDAATFHAAIKEADDVDLLVFF
jgi:hypothetical protein